MNGEMDKDQMPDEIIYVDTLHIATLMEMMEAPPRVRCYDLYTCKLSDLSIYQLPNSRNNPSVFFILVYRSTFVASCYETHGGAYTPILFCETVHGASDKIGIRIPFRNLERLFSDEFNRPGILLRNVLDFAVGKWGIPKDELKIDCYMSELEKMIALRVYPEAIADAFTTLLWRIQKLHRAPNSPTSNRAIRSSLPSSPQARTAPKTAVPATVTSKPTEPDPTASKPVTPTKPAT